MSKALERSRYTERHFSFISRVGSSSEVNSVMASMVDRLGLNPYWISYKTLYFVREE